MAGMNTEEAKACLFDVDDALRAAGLPYTLAFGTCLGAYRHQGFIPWDPDIDLGCLNEDWVEVWPRAAEELRKRGFELREISMPFDVVGTCKAYRGNVHADIPSWFKNGDERWTPTALTNRSNVLPARLMENTEDITLFDRVFQVPSPVEEYLRAAYGPDFMTPKKRGEYPKLHHYPDYRRIHGLGGYDVDIHKKTGELICV